MSPIVALENYMALHAISDANEASHDLLDNENRTPKQRPVNFVEMWKKRWAKDVKVNRILEKIIAAEIHDPEGKYKEITNEIAKLLLKEAQEDKHSFDHLEEKVKDIIKAIIEKK